MNEYTRKQYEITIHGKDFLAPQYCTCCLAPTRKTDTVKKESHTESFTTKGTFSLSVQLPLCDECFGHRQEFENKSKIPNLCSIMIGVVIDIVIFIHLSKNRMDFTFFAFLLSFIALSIIWLIVASATRLPPLSDEHSSRTQSVEVSSSQLPKGDVNAYTASQSLNITKMTFCFFNEEYAKMFIEANKGIIDNVSIHDYNREKSAGKNVFKAEGMVSVLPIGCILFFIHVALFILNMLTGLLTNNPTAFY